MSAVQAAGGVLAVVIIPVLGDLHSCTFHLQEIFNTFFKYSIKNFWTHLWLELKSSEWKISRNRVGYHWCRGIISWHTLSLLIPLKLINVAEIPRNSYNITYMTYNHRESALCVCHFSFINKSFEIIIF